VFSHERVFINIGISRPPRPFVTPATLTPKSGDRDTPTPRIYAYELSQEMTFR